MAAFSKAFCGERKTPGHDKLVVGSIKANLGHTECVSGLAAVLKAVMVLEKGLIVPNPTFAAPNPSLHLEAAGLEVSYSHAGRSVIWKRDTETQLD